MTNFNNQGHELKIIPNHYPADNHPPNSKNLNPQPLHRPASRLEKESNIDAQTPHTLNQKLHYLENFHTPPTVTAIPKDHSCTCYQEVPNCVCSPVSPPNPNETPQALPPPCLRAAPC